ncbi:CASP8-associated protein 2 isoform X2 [Paramormyrops kingsleyae]
MEKIFLDEMYGDLSLKNCDSPVVNEDSVDIYWGLDQSPVNSKNAEIVSTPILCQKLKDSMDLYEELITEEQQHKESTHNELKSKLDTAENNVKELIWRLQHAETQNEKLLNENMQLKKNISALIKTAKMEIGRKNEEINRLNHRSGRFGSGPPFPRSQINLQRREFTRLNPAGTCDLAGSVQTQEHRVSSAQKDLPQPSQKDRNVPVHRPNVEAADAPLSNSSVHDKARGVGTAIEASSKRANFVHVNKSRDSRILRPAGREGEAPSERQCTRNDDRLQVSTVTQGLAFQERTSGKCESTEKRDLHNCDDSSVSSECKVKDRGGLNSERREAGQDHVKPNKGSHPLTTDFSRKSEKVHSPPRQKRPTPEALHHRPSNSHASKGRHKDSGDAEAKSIRERRRNHDQNGLDRSTAESSGKERKQHSSSQSGVEERSSSSSRRRGQRSPPRDHRQREDKSSGNEGGGSRQERSSRMEKSKDHERKRRKESEKGQRDSSRKKDECKKEAESGSHESLRNDKQAAASNALCNRTDSNGDQAKYPASAGQRDRTKNSKDSKVTGDRCDGAKLSDKNTQNKKLSFMETLNLTLSPVKKPRLSSEGNDQANRPAEGGQEECDQFNLGEDYCVIDEVDSSHESFQEKVVQCSVSPAREDAQQPTHKSDSEESEKAPERVGNKTQLPDEVMIESEEGSHGENHTELRRAEGESPPASDNQLSGSTPLEKSPSKEKCSLSEIKDTDPDEATILSKSQDTHSEEQSETSILHPILAPVDAHLSTSSDQTGHSTCETPHPESVLTMTQDPVGIYMNTSPGNKTSGHTELWNSPVPGQSETTSEHVVGPGSLETNPDCVILMEKDGDASTDVVSSTVNMPLDTCMAEVLSNFTEALVISSTEPESSSQSGVKERSSSSSRRRGHRSPPRDHRQREDKSSGNEGGGSRQERSSRMEKSKDHERKRRKESEKGQRDSSRKKDECKKEAESGSHESLRNDKQAESPPASDNQLFGSTPLEKSPIFSTEPESDVKNSAPEHSLSKDHTLELSGVSRTFTTHVVPEPEVSSSFPSPQNCSEPNSTWNEDQDPVPSSSTSFHDEDSMMLTLKSIQFFPNVISPLTSPVRPVKNQALSSGKAPHVKSLSTEFSSVTVTFSTSTRKMDVNKENEKPDYSSVKLPQKDQTPPAASSLSSSSTTEDENELEEGEIISDSEDGSPVPASPPQNKASSVMASSNQSSPKSARLAEKDARKAPEVSAGVSGVGGKAMQSKSKKMSLPNKKPFKTFVPLLPKTNPSTIPEVMDMFTQIHTHTRNKYMKLHKTFPKKYFYNIIDMSRVSFTDFVNNVNFSKLCSTEHNLKPKLNNIISVCMNKISNNGIVKRIFEQQSPSLKKKLWNFVEGQFDFLFKEIKATLLSQCRPADVKHSSMIKCNFKNTKNNLVPLLKKLPDSIVKSSVTPMPRRKLEHKTSEPPGKKTLLPPVIPHCTGLGSRGKNLRMTVSEEDKVPERKKQDLQPVHHSAFTPSNNANSPEKPPALVRRLSHSASLQDKSDYDILTEQQTSSLTFNLVTDSQMGEIFRCLLQGGSDLMENSVSAADSNNWSVSTPRKDGTCGESFAGIPPDEAATPSKLITAWSDISPCKFSPNSKIHIPLNPAVLDESCMLEVPPSFAFDRVTPSSTVISERAYSILTEDLAVSLTIPSPLKSDGHLSFLSSVNRGPASAPDSVISARLSEDALLDGEDATEQDIHLALDSDNTSVESSGEGVSQEAITSPVFQIKPHVPMQAVVMEKSNDHFIVRIRHASTAFVSSTIHNPVDLDKLDKPQSVFSGERKGAMDAVLSASELVSVGEESPTLACQDRNVTCDDGGACSSRDAAREPAGCETESLVAHDEPAVENDESVLIKSHGKARKRKKHHPELKAKKARTDEAQGGKQRQKKSRNMNKEMRSPKEKRSGSVSIPLSPNSLSARNVVRKRGEVVVTWSREEDRDILIELKTKGASQETFSALSTKINKSPTQIEERFSQLMKLFKKKEKMKS